MSNSLHQQIATQLQLYTHYPNLVMPYFLLRNPSGGTPGLRMDDTALGSFAPVLNELLKSYHQAVKPRDVSATSNKLVADLYKLADAKIKQAVSDRAGHLADQADGILSDLRPNVRIRPAFVLRNAPLILNAQEIESLRQQLNNILSNYGTPIGIMTEEMTKVEDVQGLRDQLADEVKNSIIFP